MHYLFVNLFGISLNRPARPALAPQRFGATIFLIYIWIYPPVISSILFPKKTSAVVIEC